MSIIGGAEPSRAELLVMMRNRMKNVGFQWWPEVREQIVNLRQMKRKNFKTRGPEKGSHEDPTIDYLDICNAIMDDNSIIPGDIAYEPLSWSFPIRGIDRLGNPITVFLRLSRKEDVPLEITKFLL